MTTKKVIDIPNNTITDGHTEAVEVEVEVADTEDPLAALRTRRPLSVHEAIALVMRRMPAIGKGGTAPANMGGYKFRGIEQITSALQPILGSVGLVIVPQAESIVIDPAPGQKEAWQDTLVKFNWLVVGPDGSTLQASTYGIGRDHTDKGANKAASQAYKYLLMQLFCISDSKDDVENYDFATPPERPREKTPDEVDTDALLERLKALDDDTKQSVKDWAHTNGRTLAPSLLVTDREWRATVVELLDEIAAGGEAVGDE